MVKVKPERRSSVTSGQSSVTDSASVSGNMVLAGLGKNDGKLINVLCVTFYECGNIFYFAVIKICFAHYR